MLPSVYRAELIVTPRLRAYLLDGPVRLLEREAREVSAMQDPGVALVRSSVAAAFRRLRNADLTWAMGVIEGLRVLSLTAAAEVRLGHYDGLPPIVLTAILLRQAS